MKKTFLKMLTIVAVSLPLMSAVAAAPPKKNRPTVDQVVQRMTTKLKLTPDQQKKMKSIIEARRAKTDELDAQIKSVNEKAEADMMAQLTAEQKPLFEQMVGHRNKRAGK
jgi:Spy/CpxP family protein refolding chaperone